ncbi:MAG: zinc-dependent metalloprotease [Candidatus Eisenbacteria bacterium]|uniref:Zinc-dependent metalloprotease n=1 Tax=Eiseniibacteriota bacterium TaxID=2212470 RepID=A0A849SZH2_UNCEI|nr:zinc-dependent metalloprotease [Candidatus Eisenbacteria bacterium]
MSHRLLTRALALLALLVLLAPIASAKPKPPKGGKPAEAAAAADKDKPFTDWKKTTKDATVQKGYFNVWRKRESLWLEIQPSQLDQPVLGIFSLARGIGQNFVLGGLPLNDRLLEFHREGDHIFVVEKNTRYRAPAGSPMSKAVDLSIGSSVIASLKIESEHDSTKALLVNFGDFLLSDVSDMTEYLKSSFNNKPFRFDKERSAITSTKVFPDNFEIEAALTFSPSDRTGLGLETPSDDRYLPIAVHYSFSKLPATPMTPRFADPRTGQFLTVVKDFGRDESENFWVRFVNRWRLEKKDPNAPVSEVVKPITFYLDHTIPKEYRPFVRKGVENWQKAFEAAGYKNAIVAPDAPDDSTWDAEDVRYSTIRWITSSVPSFGAIGPSRVDPRTGEILDADILFEASFIQGFRNNYRRWAGPEAIGAMVAPQKAMRAALPSFLPLERSCALGEGMIDAGSLVSLTMLLDGLMPPGTPVPEEYLGEAIVWTTMHEVGHSLGLTHNFRSSTATPNDKLNDLGWTDTKGLVGSVMEYPSPNISSDRSKQGHYYTTTIGTCDMWQIRYAYTPSGAANSDEDYVFARKIADESALPGNEYGADQDAYPDDALDPRVNIWDLGTDPLAFAKDRAAYVASLWKNPKLEERVVGPNGDYPTLRRALDTTLGQYSIALGLAVKYLGGQYASRTRRGQEGGVDPLTLIPAATQREALEFLGTRAFAADAFAIPSGLLSKVGQDRWVHWGIGNGFSGPYRYDYDLGAKAFSIQSALLTELLEPRLLLRMREAEGRSADAFRMSDYFDRMTRMLWGEVAGGAPAALKALDGTSTRRDVQRAYVDRLAGLMVGSVAGAPDDARALARLQLSRIDQRCTRQLASEAPMGDYTRAHLLESRARIKRAMDATRSADSVRGASAIGADAAGGTSSGAAQ